MDLRVGESLDAAKRARARRRLVLTRRALLAGGGTVAAAGGFLVWHINEHPYFWDRYSADLQRGILPAPRTPAPARWPAHGLHAAWIGHSTVLLQADGFTILTDPQFSDWAGIHFGPVPVGFKRLVAPALRVRDLPPIDLVLISHAHLDHLDTPSLRALENPRTAVITATRTADLLRPARYRNVAEIGWGGEARVGPATVRAFEVNHWGTRLRSDDYRGYNGYTVEVGRFRILFAGDTGFCERFAALRTSRPFDLALMPIGCYNPFREHHCTPEDAWKMAGAAGAARVIPIHHQTFALSYEPPQEPIARLLEAAGRDAARVAVRSIGQEFHLAV